MRVVNAYYSKLFLSSRPPIDKDLIENVEVRLTDAMRDVLLKPYSKDDVVMALKDMHPTKAPGPDGFPALFYSRFWDVVGEEVCSMVVRFLNFGGMPAKVNNTHVVLILSQKAS